MTATSLSDHIAGLNRVWGNKGLPRETWANTGRLGKAMAMDASKDWSGENTAETPFWVGFNGMVGANYSEAYNNGAPSSILRYSFPQRLMKVVVTLEEQLLASVANGTASQYRVAAKMKELSLSMGALARAFSYLVWGDGTGRIAKGDGAFAVAGTSIKLKNRKDAQKFERGDRLVFIDQAAAVPSGGQPTPRAFAVAPNDFLKVTNVDRETGTLTVDKVVNVAIPTAANTDYISKTVHFDARYGTLDGIYRTIARTRTEASSTLFGVDRSLDPTRLAGQRLEISPTESPYEVVGRMLEKAADHIDADRPGAQWMIYCTSAVLPDLMREARANGVQFVDRAVKSDRQRMVMGFTYPAAVWPDFGEIGIVSDKFFTNPNVTAEEDKAYQFLSLDNLYCKMTPDGMGYKKFEDGGGYLKQIPGALDYYAQGGFWGNTIVEGYNEFIYAGQGTTV